MNSKMIPQRGKYGQILGYLDSRCPVVTKQYDQAIETFRSGNGITLDEALQQIAYWNHKEWQFPEDLQTYARELLEKIKV